MKRLLSMLYSNAELPWTLWHGRDLIGDTVFHDHVNTALHVGFANRSSSNFFTDTDKSEQILEAKYARYQKGGETDWEAAYHLVGVRDLATLEKGDVASMLNADSYNAFAACESSHGGSIHDNADAYISSTRVSCGNPTCTSANPYRRESRSSKSSP